MYIVRFRHAGHRYAISTSERDARKASRAAQVIYSDVLSGKRQRGRQNEPMTAPTPTAPDPGVTLADAAVEWLKDIASSLDEATVKQYGCYVTAHWAGQFDTLDGVTKLSAETYWRERLKKVKRKTVLKELSALRGLLRWCKENDLIEEVPLVSSPPRRATGTPDTRRPHKSGPVELEEKEALAIIRQLPEWSPGGRRSPPFPVRARFEFAWETALRPSTLEALCAPDDYLPGRATLMIRDAADKARFGRELPLTAEARAALDRVCPKSGLIFGKHDCRPFLQAAAKASGLPEEKAKRFSPYDLRHGRLTFLAENSTNLPGIAYLAGHKQLTTTNHYLKSSRRAAETVLAAVSAAQKSEFGIHTGYTDEAPDPRSHVSAGANGETRTLTGVTPQEPESCASTNSATFARGYEGDP